MSPESQRSRQALIALLQLAYSGELAAAHAYRGHWNSVADPEERRRIRTIEDEEWHHRALVGEMLAALEVTPDRWRERRALAVGKTLGLACHVAGWFTPMYGAGKLESRNVREYETAARLARDCGCASFVDCLLAMAEVEWEHEHYFRGKVASHRATRFVRLWPAPPPKETIRSSFARESRVADVSQHALANVDA